MDNNLIENIKKEKTVAMLAPTFPIDFKFPEIIIELKKIWFDKVVELTYAAKLINKEYINLIKKNKDKQFICTNCPTTTKYILNRYPQHKDKLANIASPMVIMSRFVKKEFWPEYKTFFIWPCSAKKFEAKESWDVDFALTFKELKEIFEYYKENKLEYCDYEDNRTEDWDPDFNKFYNDYTKIYPITWAVAETMHYKWIINKDQIIVWDQIKEIDQAIQQMEKDKNIVFLDLLACPWWCTGWNWMDCKLDTKTKQDKIYEYKNYCKKDKIWKNLWKFEYAKNLNFKNNLIK